MGMSYAQKMELEKLVDFLVDKIIEADDFSSLLIDQYGNYFCQKLFPRLKDQHKSKLLSDLEKICVGEKKPFLSQIGEAPGDISQFLKVAQDSKGTHSLQVFIQNLESPEFKIRLSALIESQNPLYFAFNKHATHVLIKYIEITTENPYLNGIYENITKNFTILSVDSNGLPLVKKVLAWIRTPVFKMNMN